MKTPTKRATRRLAASLAIIAALATTGGAWAADVIWTGAVDNYYSKTGNWSGNKLATNDSLKFTSDSYNSRFTENVILVDGAYANNWSCYINGVGSAYDPLILSATDPAYGVQFSKDKGTELATSADAYLRLESGTWSINGHNLTIGKKDSYKGELTLANGASLNVGHRLFFDNADNKLSVESGSSLSVTQYFCLRAGEVKVENGTIEVKSGYPLEIGDYSAANLLLNNGGLLITKQIAKKTYGGTVLFNGGTLRSNKDNATLIDDDNVLTVKVGALGGTIDANTFAVSFPRPIAPDGENDGGMTFKGGGSVSLKYANTYTGATKVELGTKIIATTSDAKASVLGNLVVTGVAADGDYYVFEYSGLTDEDVAGATISHGGAAGTTVTRDGNQIKVHYVAPAVDLGWNGGNAAWATANAWTNATGTAKTWSDGNYAVFATGDTVTLGADVAAVSVTFNADATIAAGDGTLTVPVVDVGSGVLATIAAPTAGALEKTGTGTLTLGSSRSDATTLSEGTLVMAPGATLAALTLGTDATKPVTFDYGGQTYSSTYINNGLEVTLTNCTFSSFSRVANGTVHVAKDAKASISGWITVGPESELANTAAMLDICGGVVSNATKNIGIGDHGLLGSSAEVRVRNGGLFATTHGIIVGSRAAATLTIDEGTVVAQYDILFCDSSSEVVSGEDSFLNLNAGGLLWVRSITYGSGAANATFTFNGGTLKANQDNTLIANKTRLSVVTATSGTIDADGHAVTIAKAISGAGGMAYKGGGKVTLTAQPTYTGVTTVEVGTTLVIPTAIAGSSLAFTIPGELADGVYTVVSISGDSQFADDVLSGKAEGFVLSGDKKKICYVKGMDATKPIYIGTDGNLSTAGNWLDGTAPTGGTGDAQIFCATAATLTVGDTFAPAKFIIPDGSALVTIGSGTLCVGEVENRQLLAVGAGATVVIGDQLTLAKNESLCDQNNGTLVVSNLLLKAENGDRYVTTNQTASSSGVFKFNAVTNSMTDNWLYLADKNSVATNEFYIGEGGLNFLNASGTAGYCLGRNSTGNSTTIRPWYSNFTIADRGNGNHSLMLTRNVTFCTDDESGTGRIITIEAQTRSQYSPAITVSGTGTLQVNSTCDNRNEPTVTVTDSATLAFGAGATLGTGAITLGNGTKLTLTATNSTFTALSNTLNLPTGENEVATIRIDGTRLRSGDNQEIATVASGTTANVTLDPASAVLYGHKGTLRVEDGNLILSIKSTGLMVIFR